MKHQSLDVDANAKHQTFNVNQCELNIKSQALNYSFQNL